MKTQLLDFSGEVVREAHIAKSPLNAPPILYWNHRFFVFSLARTRANHEKALIFKEVDGQHLNNLELATNEQ